MIVIFVALTLSFIYILGWLHVFRKGWSPYKRQIWWWACSSHYKRWRFLQV